MASDNLLKVIAGLVKREGQIRREDAKKVKEALKAEAEEDEDEEDEDEDPVGEPTPEEEPEKEDEPEEKPEKEPEEDDGAGDTKPTGPDPALVAQIAAIVKKEIEDEGKEKKETEVKLSGKKEKIDTKPKMEQRMGRMNFKEAIRRSVTGTHLAEGYEEVVLGIMEDESIKGPLGYEPFFEKGKLFVQKGQERTAQKALKNSKEINKVPKIIGEEMEAEEYLAMEAVDVDGRCSGFKEALRRLTYEKIRQMKEKEETKKEEVEVDESNELQAIMALDDEGIEAEINKKGELTVKKKDLKKAEKALKKSFKKGGIPKLVGEEAELTNEESKLQKEYKAFYAKMLEKFGVKSPGELDDDKKKEFYDAIEKGWKEGEGPVKEEVEIEEDAIPEGLNKEDAASFMAAASAAKRDGKKTFKFGDPEKEYPVTIKVDIPLKKEEAEIDEKKMTADAKRKQNVKRKTPAGKKAAKKSAKKAAKYFKATGKTARDPQAAAKKARKARMNSFVPGGSMIEKWKSAAFDKVRAIRSRLGESNDAHTERELKLYIEADQDLYKQQIVPIIENVQRKMKSGKYDHAQAPELWMYLVDNGAKKYVKEFGGDANKDFPKDLRLSIANQFANEYKAEIEIQDGEMI